jgi:hypothetical protein
MFRKALYSSLAVAGLLTLGLSAASAASAAPVKVHPAETGSCGTNCIEPYFLASGSQWVQSAASGKKNTEVTLNYSTTTNSHEDFLPIDVGTVVNEYCPDTTSSPVEPAVDPLFTANQCAGLDLAGLDDATAWQVEYEPLGVPSHECVSSYNNGKPKAGALVRLSPCGEDASSVWIKDTDVVNPFGTAPYISGASNNFSDPLVITEGNGGPDAQKLFFEQLNVDSNNIVASTQLVGILPGL